MRTWCLVLLACAVALILPLLSAGDDSADGFEHLTVDRRTLPPGGNQTLDLFSHEGPFRTGWVFILYGRAENATVVVNLTSPEGHQDQFRWEPGGFHRNLTLLKAAGDHVLSVWNPSERNATYEFYYDLSCNCASKTVPLPGGFVIFNYDLPASRQVFVGFPMIERWALSGAVATLGPGDAPISWPDSFEVVQEREARGKGWLNFTFTTERDDRYFVFVEAREGAYRELPVFLGPLLEVGDPDSRGAAGPAGPLLLAAPAAAARAWSAKASRSTRRRAPGS